MTLRSLIVLAMASVASAHCGAGGTSTRCTPGETRACSLALEAGYSQEGTQSCGADHAWSECVGAGACHDAAGNAVAPYAQCTDDAQCGAAGCAACIGYSSVQNPAGQRVCAPYCATDADCAPSGSSAGVTPQCALGQCVVLCHSSSTCPNGTQCLPWLDAHSASANPGYDGLCD